MSGEHSPLGGENGEKKLRGGEFCLKEMVGSILKECNHVLQKEGGHLSEKSFSI